METWEIENAKFIGSAPEAGTETRLSASRDLGISVEVGDCTATAPVQRMADELVAAKTHLNNEMKTICSDIDNMYRMSSEFRRDTRRLEKGVDALPVLEDWLHEKVSAIEQLKSQIIFLHKIMDED